MSFSINDVKTVLEIHNASSVNAHLKNGWTLLSAGFDSGQHGSNPIYILGRTSEPDQSKSSVKKTIQKIENNLEKL